MARRPKYELYNVTQDDPVGVGGIVLGGEPGSRGYPCEPHGGILIRMTPSVTAHFRFETQPKGLTAGLSLRLPPCVMPISLWFHAFFFCSFVGQGDDTMRIVYALSAPVCHLGSVGGMCSTERRFRREPHGSPHPRADHGDGCHQSFRRGESPSAPVADGEEYPELHGNGDRRPTERYAPGSHPKADVTELAFEIQYLDGAAASMSLPGLSGRHVEKHHAGPTVAADIKERVLTSPRPERPPLRSRIAITPHWASG